MVAVEEEVEGMVATYFVIMLLVVEVVAGGKGDLHMCLDKHIIIIKQYNVQLERLQGPPLVEGEREEVQLVV